MAKAVAATDQDPYPTKKIDVSKVKGKTFWVIMLTAAVPTQVEYAESFEAAVEAAGGTVKIFDGKAQPTVWAQGINSAVAAKADGILTITIPSEAIEKPLADAKAAGVPVIEGSGPSPTPPFAEGITGGATMVNSEIGEVSADYALQATECKAKAIVVASLTSPVSAQIATGTEKRLKEVCGSSCSSKTVDIAAPDIATKLTGKVQTLLQRNPDTNVIISGLFIYNPAIEQALKTLGKDIPLVSVTSQAALKGEPRGQVAANVLLAPSKVFGWYYANAMFEAVNGTKDVSVTVPVALLDESNWDSSDFSSPKNGKRFSDYEERFRELWGLTK